VIETLWTVFSTLLKVIGFLGFKMLSIMFVVRKTMSYMTNISIRTKMLIRVTSFIDRRAFTSGIKRNCVRKLLKEMERWTQMM